MNQSSDLTNPTPWDLPLVQRLHALKPGTLRVAYFSELPDAASFRYRCYNMAQAINEHLTGVSASYFFLADLDAMDDLHDFADVLVLSRVRYDGKVHRLIESFRSAGRRVISDIDDLIFSPQYAGLVATSLNHATEGKVIDSWFAFLSRVGETMRLSDEIIVSTPHLAGLVAQEFTKPIHVIPNFLNNEQLSVAGSLPPRQRRGAGIRYGYFSGSNSHALDFLTMAPALARHLEKNPTTEFVIAGYLDLPPVLEPFADRIERLAFMNILELQAAMASVDINVVPLQHNDFTHCKSELKFFEAALVETPTIAAATPVFQSAIDHGLNGFLVNDHDWDGALDHVASVSNAELRRVGTAASVTARERFTPAAVAPDIKKALRLK
jgi:glycosyltransferase involved in cell wall biosynthesis